MDRKGLTIVELIAVLMLMSVMLVGVTQLYVFALGLWRQNLERQAAAGELSQSLEQLVRALRHARSIDQIDDSSISFSADLGDGLKAYRAYLYHASDGEPNPPYSQSSYELRFASEDILYGEGAVLATGIKPPASPLFSRSDELISIDLTKEFLDSQWEWRSKVQLRNL